MVFEHLASSLAKTILMLQQLVKIEMKDMSQGIAVSSFDHRLPSLLIDETGYKYPDESHFNKVKNYKEWEEPYTGFRDRLKHDLIAFNLTHQDIVLNNTQPSSPLQASASLSRTDTASWISAFLAFI
jgi:hypothetical protein